jgi:hypothetical protein
MTPALQLRSQLPVIVDLSIEHHLNPAILIGHGLRAGGREIDQSEPAMYQLTPVALVEAAPVRAAMSQERVGPRGPERVRR